MNPNYGIEIGNSIVFTGSVPILAIIFKTFKFITRKKRNGVIETQHQLIHLSGWIKLLLTRRINLI